MKNNRKIFLLLTGLFAANIFLGWAVLEKSFFRRLEVVFFDVGQGDAILIKTPGSNQILIDGGPDSKILEKLGGEMPFWDRSIEAVILTHPDSDHLAGIIHVLKNFEVKFLVWTGQEKNSDDFAEFKRILSAESIDVLKARFGQEFSFLGGNLRIIFPFPEMDPGKKTNDFSVMARLDFGEVSFLLPGDIGLDSQKAVLEQMPDLVDVDILKVSHHGSKNSNDDFTTEKISPELAVIQVGAKNRYGLPSAEALASLSKFASILRTDEKGDIRIISDGKNYKIKTEK